MTRRLLSSALAAVVAVVLAAAILVPAPEPAASAECPPGFHLERESIRGMTAQAQDVRPEYAGGIDMELNQLREDGCVPLQRGEPFSELALRDAEASAIRSAPFASIAAGAVRSGANERQALLAANPSVPGNNGTVAKYGKGPLNFDEEPYDAGNGIVDSTGRIDDFEYDAASNRLFAAIGTGGVWLSEDRGEQWRPITDNLPTTVVSAVAYTSHGGPNGTVLVLTGEHTFGGSAYTGIGAYYSRDLGATWKRASGVPDGALAFAIEVDPTNPQVVYAATSKGLRRSVDGGLTYTDVVLPTGDCAGRYGAEKCNYANMVTDVVIQTPGGSTEVEGGAVVAAVGWRAGMHENEGKGVQSPNNGVYRSETGAPKSFERLDGLDSVVGGKERLGRIELGPAVGEQQNHNYLYSIVEDAVLFNGGVRYEPIEGGLTGSNATVFNGVYVSPDFGATWTKLADDVELSQACAAKKSVYCIPGLIEPGAQAWYNMWVHPDPTAQVGGVPSRVLLGLEEVWQTTNNGIPHNSDASTFDVIGAYYAGADCLLVITDCAASGNAGVETTHPDQHAAIMLPTVNDSGEPDGNVELFVGHDGGLSRQIAGRPGVDDFDQGSWNLVQENGLQTLLPYSAVWANDGVAYAGLQDNGHMRVNPEDQKQYETYGADGTFAAVDPNNSDYAWESTQNAGMNVTTDGGQTWRSASSPDSNVRFVNPFDMDPLDPNHLVTGGRVIYATLAGPNTADGDEANEWKPVFDLGVAPGVEQPGNDAGSPPAMGQSAIDVRGPGVYVGFCGVCDILNTTFPFRSGIATNVGTNVLPEKGTDKGWHFATGRGLPNRFVTGVAIDPQDETLETIYVTLGGYSRRWVPPGTEGESNDRLGEGHVYKSTDAGENFVDISGNLPDVPALWVEPRGDQLLIGTDIGAYISSDTVGGDWAALGGGKLPATPVTSIMLKPDNPNQALLGLYGRGLWTYTFPADAPQVPKPPAPKPVKGKAVVQLKPKALGDVLAGPFGFETDAEGWEVTVAGNPDTQWKLMPPGHDSEQSFGVSPYGDLADTTLVSPPLETKGGRTFISWWTRYDIEGGGYDEYQVEWSQDGETWNSVATVGGQNFGYPDGWSREQALITTEPGEFFVRFPFYSDEICSSTGGPLCARTDGYEGAFVDDIMAQQGCGPYPDIKGNVHARAIQAVSDVGIACGFADGAYGPARNITRGQMATMIANALSLPDPGADAPRFSDIKGNVHARNIRAVAEAGVAEGVGGDRFRPNAPVTRGQMASFIAKGFNLPAPGPNAPTFSDIAGTTHARNIRAVAAVSIALGYDDGTYRPGVALNRAQMATFMAKSAGLG